MKRVITAALVLLVVISCKVHAGDISAIHAALMPYIRAELRGTDAEKRINVFYGGAAFKKLGSKTYSFNLSNQAGVDSYFLHEDKKVYLTRRYIEDTLKLDLKLPAKGFYANKTSMARMAACVAPLLVHETKHQQEWAELGEQGIKPVVTRESEYIAAYETYLFLSEKQLKHGRNYYDSCTPAFRNLILFGDKGGVQGVSALVDKEYGPNKQVFAAFTKDNIVGLVSSLMATYGEEPVAMEQERVKAFRRDLTRLGIIQPGERVLITVNDFLSTGKYNWNRITFAELDLAYQGKNALFNKYEAWFNKQRAYYKDQLNQMRRYKELHKLLADAEQEAKENKQPAYI